MVGQRRNIGVGLLSGIIGGLVGTFVMSEVRTMLQPPQRPTFWSKREREQRARAAGSQDATKKAADKLAQAVLRRKLSKQEKEVAGPLVHYTYGSLSGGFYGLATALEPQLGAGAGLPFGAAVWLLGDELATPALGLTPSSKHYPLSTHLYSLATHLVYGVTTDAMRRLLRGLL